MGAMLNICTAGFDLLKVKKKIIKQDQKRNQS